MKKRRYIFLSIWSVYLIWAVTSCISKPKFDFRPDIEFDRISVTRITDLLGNAADSISISIKFKDGDGDLGAFADDTEDNFFVNLYQRRNGRFVLFDLPDDDLNFNGVFPDLNADGQGPIEGRLKYSFPSIRVATYNRLNIPKNDIWKFEIYIKDRAGQASDTIFTDSIMVNIQ